MRQIFFDGKGQLLIQEVPVPLPINNGALVRTHASLISSGTEIAASTGGGNLIRKALEQPELIIRALQLARREGLKFTAGQVRDISESWFPTGYSAAGVVVSPGHDASGLKAGDRVACAGAGYANHADYIAVPGNLIARIPEGVSLLQASFTTVGAIALQGVRRAEISLGDTVVVIGLGLLGQIAAQLLDAAGCRVLGIDPVGERRELAARLSGAYTLDPSLNDSVEQVMALTDGVGADRVILCAATRASEPTNDAFRMSREHGRVVMVGAMGMDLDRTDFYNRELDFVISRSLGPGRYDPRYEEQGIDYPIGLVRWTEQRNMVAFLDLIAGGKLDIDSLIGAIFPIEQADKAYNAVKEGRLGVVLTYTDAAESTDRPDMRLTHSVIVAPEIAKSGKVGLGLVGAGSFARAVHLPNIHGSDRFQLQAVVSGSASAAQVACKYSVPTAATDIDEVLADSSVDAILIATRHHLHAEQAIAAARAGKHIFVEKPLALTTADCYDILKAVQEAGVLLTVGFNRRLAPTARKLADILNGIPGPQTILYRINAGAIPRTHWLNDPAEGGGRLLGEGVHFFDLVCGLVGREPVMVDGQGSADGQNFTVSLRFADDSLAVVVYTALGDPSYAKERVEIFAGGGVAVLDDFVSLSFTGLPGKSVRMRQDKGHKALLENFGKAIQGKEPLAITGADGLRATCIALAALESIQTGMAISYNDPGVLPLDTPDA